MENLQKREVPLSIFPLSYLYDAMRIDVHIFRGLSGEKPTHETLAKMKITRFGVYRVFMWPHEKKQFSVCQWKSRDVTVMSAMTNQPRKVPGIR